MPNFWQLRMQSTPKFSGDPKFYFTVVIYFIVTNQTERVRLDWAKHMQETWGRCCHDEQLVLLDRHGTGRD
jgi:hypothetical protein